MKKVSQLVFAICMATAGFSQIGHTADAFDYNSQWMLGDWNGERSALEQQGYHFDIGYTGESATLIDASRDASHKTAYSGQLAVGADFNLEKILGWQDTEAKVAVTWRDGHDLKNNSSALDGQLSSVQEVYGRGQTWRLTDFWIKKKFLDRRLDIKVGRFGESEDFNAVACDFQNLALCGDQMGNWSAGDQIHNWPVSQWAARVKYAIAVDVFAQVGVYEYNPENLKRGKGFNLSTDGSKGAVIPVEVVWQPQAAINGLPGEYRVGYYYSTADVDELNTNKTTHAQGGWLSFKQQLSTVSGNKDRGLSLIGQFAFFDKDSSEKSDSQSLALAYKGLTDHRPRDELAIGVARIGLNDKAVTNVNKDAEYNAEIYYGIHATNWLTVRPNLQYVSHIGGIDRNHDDAWVGGIKFITAF